MQDILSRYTLMVSFLGNTLSGSCEVYLLDALQKSFPVIAQSHGHHHTLPRLKKLVREALSSAKAIENGILLNRGLFSSSGKMSKCSLYFIKDEGGKAVAVLCLVVRMQAYIELQGYLESLLHFDTTDYNEAEPLSVESVAYEAPSLERMERMIWEFSSEPQRLNPEEKTELLLDLYDTGVFELKGAVAKAAEALQMSEQSIYRYLSKVKRLRE